MSTWYDENRWYVRLMNLAHELAMEGKGREAQDLRGAIDDAARYRWLRDHALQVLIEGPVVCAADKWGELATVNGKHITRDGHDLDAEIDAARAAWESAKRDEKPSEAQALGGDLWGGGRF
jgi:Ser-tRNA(Ala) deacylase AlaX